MTHTPIILVPGFWLGAWAWDEVAAALRADGYDATALTLPGLESAEADRSEVALADHVSAICAAVDAAPAPVLLAVHSGAGIPGYAVSDQRPERIAAVVYVDSAPGTGALNPDFEGTEYPLPTWDDLDENLDGLSEEQLETFRRRAVPEPAGAIRDAPELGNEARLDVPTYVICTGASSDQVKSWIPGGAAWLGGLAELRDVTYLDLPTSHWPMWSRPADLARIIGDIAGR
jgi:pimeloyl-ACP methyl ester carboxylesterase